MVPCKELQALHWEPKAVLTGFRQGVWLYLGSCYPLGLRSRLLEATGTDRYPNFPLLDTSEVRGKKKESSLEGFSFLTSYPNWIWAQRLKTYSFPGNEEFCQDRPVERIGTRCLMLLMNSQLLEPRGKAGRWASIPGTPMFVLSRASPPECGKSLAALASTARNCPVLTNCLSPGQIMAVVRRGFFVLVLPTMQPTNHETVVSLLQFL